MSTEKKILADLAVSQTTASSIAGRIDVPTEAVEVILKRLHRDGKVSQRPLKNLTVWFLIKSSQISNPKTAQP